MDFSTIEKYVGKVYAYAVKRTFSSEEAEDLSQEILCTVLCKLPELRKEDSFEAWLWGIAGNVTKSFRRKLGKQRAMFSYDIPEDLASEEENPLENEEMYAFLRKKITMLSAVYREIIILYYYDGLSTKQIAERLDIPEGTVTWRLSEARKKLKKECIEMKESALRPVKIKFDIYGSFNCDGKKTPFPDVYINDALSQNILYYCYEEPHTMEELAKLCGVPAYYIEERMDHLIKREAVTEPVKGKYRTDFIIWSDKYNIYCEENAEKALMPMMDKLIAALKNIAREAGQIDFYKAGKSETDLFYLYGIMAFNYAARRCCRLPYPEIKEKYDGERWCYVGSMETKEHCRTGIGTQHCSNKGSRGSYSHTVYAGISGFSWREMMYDSWINACEDILKSGHSEDGDAAALAIQEGYILRKEDGSFFVTVPAFTKEQKAGFDEIVSRYLVPLMDEYSELTEKFIAGYKKLFPKHLGEDADRMCRSLFVGLYQVIAAYAQRTGAVGAPSAGSYCDVMLQVK